MNELELTIKQLLIDTLNLEDMKPSEICSEDPLFGEGLGLDSIDALELGIAIKQRFGISVEADNDKTRQAFSSVRNLALFISESSTNLESSTSHPNATSSAVSAS